MALDKYSRERLLKVAEVLENLPKKRKFNRANWFEGFPGECGTAACAIGYATLDPWFKKRGFGCDNIEPIYRESEGWSAVHEFFRLNEDQSDWLFALENYARGNRYDVIRRIRKFVKNDSAIT